MRAKLARVLPSVAVALAIAGGAYAERQQRQIDDALASIDRIIGNTQFNGRKLLDGSLGIQTTLSDAGAPGHPRRFYRVEAQ